MVFEKEELALLNSNLKEKLSKLDTKSEESRTLEIKSSDKTHFIDLNHLRYISAENDGGRFYLEDGRSIWLDISLKALLDKLPNDRYIRIYRGTIVNLDHVEWVNHSSLRMKAGEDLKIGRTYKTNLTNVFKA